MVRYLLAAGCAFLFAALSGSAAAAPGSHRYVAPGGSDAGDCTKSPCLTIQYAVDQANAGDTIDVSAGTYMEQVEVTTSLKLVGHNAVIDGTDGDSYRPNGIFIHDAGAAGTEVRGFTVQNAGREAIWVLQTSNVTIDHNTVVHNDAYGPFSDGCPADSPDDCGEAIHLESVTDSQVSHNLVQDNVGGILLTDEEGPTAHNEIDHNQVLDNSKDCGITLASHYFTIPGPVDPADGGVYENTIEHNTSNNNGAAGIGLFAGPPGAAAWGNVVAHNTANGNGLPGIAIHSHFGFQNAENNVVMDNFVSGNGEDDDAGTGADTGIIVFADTVFHDPPGFPQANPIQSTTVSGNHVSDEHYGIYLKGASDPSGLASNHYAGSVDVPVQHG
jgi:hypothetical protein